MHRKWLIAITAILTSLGLGGGTTLMAVEKKQPQAIARASSAMSLAQPSVSVAAIEGATFTGSQACQDCHAKEYKEWSASGHANMLRPVSPGIVKADFSGIEIPYEGVEVEDADKNKVKISPKVKAETKDGKYFVTLLDVDSPANTQSYEVVEVLGSLWEQQYYVKVGDKVFPSPVRWVENDKQWRKAAFAPFWWTAMEPLMAGPKNPRKCRPSRPLTTSATVATPRLSARRRMTKASTASPGRKAA